MLSLRAVRVAVLAVAGGLLMAPVWADQAPLAMPTQVPGQVPVADLLEPAVLASADRSGMGAAPARGPLAPAGLTYPLATSALQIDPWGWRFSESRGAWRMHTGVDFAAPTGTAVLAALGGVVVLAEEISGYGLTVVLDHGEGLQTLYAHLQTIDVPLGQVLEPGQRLGTVGMTGRASGPHLHFELRSRGSQTVALDPIPYLPPLLPPPALTAAQP